MSKITNVKHSNEILPQSSIDRAEATFKRIKLNLVEVVKIKNLKNIEQIELEQAESKIQTFTKSVDQFKEGVGKIRQLHFMEIKKIKQVQCKKKKGKGEKQHLLGEHMKLPKHIEVRGIRIRKWMSDIERIKKDIKSLLEIINVQKELVWHFKKEDYRTDIVKSIETSFMVLKRENVEETRTSKRCSKQLICCCIIMLITSIILLMFIVIAIIAKILK